MCTGKRQHVMVAEVVMMHSVLNMHLINLWNNRWGAAVRREVHDGDTGYVMVCG